MTNCNLGMSEDDIEEFIEELTNSSGISGVVLELEKECLAEEEARKNKTAEEEEFLENLQ